MLLSVMREVRNFFACSAETGDFSLAGGQIALNNTYKTGQYILLTGSLLADGVYKITAENGGVYTLDGAAIDEDWHGIVYGLRIPPAFITLCGEIKTFTESPEGRPSGITSENVTGVHSWNRPAAKNGVPAGWQTVFSKQLAPYRKMFAEVVI